jgi:hypothetical protein
MTRFENNDSAQFPPSFFVCVRTTRPAPARSYSKPSATISKATKVTDKLVVNGIEVAL